MTIGVRWFSIVPGSGYGNASAAYLSGLRQAGIPVSWTVLGWPSTTWPDRYYGPVAAPDVDGLVHSDIVDRPIEHDTVVFYSPPFWDERLAGEAAGRRLVAYTTSETDRLRHESAEILNRYDLVLVPSHFNAAVFQSSGVTVPIQVVPHVARPVDLSTAKRRRSPTNPTCVFYLIATWTTRKAILDAVEAFLLAFTGSDDVELLIHTTPEDHIALARKAVGDEAWNLHPGASWFTLAQALAGRTNVPRIVLSTRRLDENEMDALHERGDCFLSLSRGEGWGLPACDAAAFGNPVIATGWSATPELLPGDYPYLVDYDLVPTSSELADDWWEPAEGERCAKARLPHAAALLRYVFEHRDEARAWGRRLQVNVLAQYNSATVTRRLIEALDGG